MTAFIRIAALSLVLISGGAVQAALAASTAAPAAATNDPAAKTVEAFHAVLLDTMKHAKELGVQGRYKKLEPAVDAAFDIPAMTQAIVGPSWANMSAADRKSVIDAFRRTTIAELRAKFRRLQWRAVRYQPTGAGSRRGEDRLYTNDADWKYARVVHLQARQYPRWLEDRRCVRERIRQSGCDEALGIRGHAQERRGGFAGAEVERAGGFHSEGRLIFIP